MKKFKIYADSARRKTEIENRIMEVEAEISDTKMDILGNVLPLKLIRRLGRNVSPMPVKVGTQLLATRLVANSNPIIRMATPFVTNGVINYVSEVENKRAILAKAHSFFSWLADKTKLTAIDEQKLLYAEVSVIKEDVEEMESVLKPRPYLELNETGVFYDATLDVEKLSLY